MGYYDIAQVCMNGHMVNDQANSSPEFNAAHCQECGKPTIVECPECKAPIRGDYIGNVVVIGHVTPTPTHCHSCGKPYPWKAKVEKTRKTKGEIKKSLPDRLKQSAVGGLVFGALVAVGWMGDWWQKLPVEWRDWLVKNTQTVEIKSPSGNTTTEPKQTFLPIKVMAGNADFQNLVKLKGGHHYRLKPESKWKWDCAVGFEGKERFDADGTVKSVVSDKDGNDMQPDLQYRGKRLCALLIREGQNGEIKHLPMTGLLLNPAVDEDVYFVMNDGRHLNDSKQDEKGYEGNPGFQIVTVTEE